ncbi:MAG: two-component system invasion response regulator UvrY [Chitinophagales bacterium]|jgi:two-component system invasion response regulator UvrY
MSQEDLITVMLVDDHDLVRVGYRMLLESYPRMTVVAEADDGESACFQYGNVNPDVVVLDLSMPGIGGMETIRRLRAIDSATKILVFSMHDSKLIVGRAIDAGASGYLVKGSTAEKMVDAIRQVSAGNTYLNRDLPSDTG